MAKVLLVEDYEDIGLIVRDYLQASEYTVEFMQTATDARSCLASNRYDVIILDWDLPDGSGIEICREFRDKGGLTPILLMTGRSALDEKETGLDAGADDYITKPFALRELTARLKAMLRRSTTYASPGLDSTGEPKAGMLAGGKYRLDEQIGEGGMSVIWRATDISMGRAVVIKLVRGYLAKDDRTMKRFEQECRVMAQLNNPNVVMVFDVGTVDGKLPFLVMEYVRGISLRELLTRRAPLPVYQALRILIQVCRGLQAAHEAGIIHRDLKPDNIIVQEDLNRPDAIKIVDFGIALLTHGSCERVTRDGMVIGTMEYISPEQLDDVQLDGRADVYALGVVLFELLTGELPFQASTPEAVMLKHLREAPRLPSSLRPNISALDQIVLKALAKNRDKRYESAAALRTELEQALLNLKDWH
jgi:serine/threonine protein kinase